MKLNFKDHLFINYKVRIYVNFLEMKVIILYGSQTGNAQDIAER
jgi:hypothetical protein